jgi:hypothetical protein
MLFNNGKWITENDKLITIEYPLLLWGQMIQAQKTLPLTDRLWIDLGPGAHDSPGIVLHGYDVAIQFDLMSPNLREPIIPLNQLRP